MLDHPRTTWITYTHTICFLPFLAITLLSEISLLGLLRERRLWVEQLNTMPWDNLVSSDQAFSSPPSPSPLLHLYQTRSVQGLRSNGWDSGSHYGDWRNLELNQSSTPWILDSQTEAQRDTCVSQGFHSKSLRQEPVLAPPARVACPPTVT